MFVEVILGNVYTPLGVCVRGHNPGNTGGTSSWSQLSLLPRFSDCPTFPLAVPALVSIESRVQPPLSRVNRETGVCLLTKLLVCDSKFSSKINRTHSLLLAGSRGEPLGTDATQCRIDLFRASSQHDVFRKEDSTFYMAVSSSILHAPFSSHVSSCRTLVRTCETPTVDLRG